MNTLKPVRLTRAWQFYPKGHVFTSMPAAQAQHMLAAGQAEYVTEDVAVSPVTGHIPASPVDRMMRPARPARRQVLSRAPD